MKNTVILLLFVIIKIVLQFFLIDPGYDLHRDEYLHLDQAHHLAWGYLSVPPVTSWFSYLIWLLGNDVFWVRFFPALFGALTIVVVWHIIKELKGGYYAQILAATALTFSALARINLLFQPNSFDILAWTFVCFALIKHISTQQNRWLYVMSVGFAIGFLNKYNIVFLVAGIVPALLFTRNSRILANGHIIGATLLALLTISPNLYWQYDNYWPVLHHMKELNETQLINADRGGFIKEQLLFFIGTFYLVPAALIGFLAYIPFKKYRVFFVSFFIVLGIFIWFKAKGYYALGLYPVYIGFGSVYLEELLQTGKKRFIKPVLVILAIALFIPIATVAFPIYSPKEISTISARYKKLELSRWEDDKLHDLPQDFADMQGWRAIALMAENAYHKVDTNNNTLVLCDNYGQAGAINYYSTDPNIQAVTMNADYVNWIDLNKKYANVILVQEASDDDPEREKEKPLFESVTRYGKLNNPLARENGTSIYILKGAKVDIRPLLKADITDEKNRWKGFETK
ncbi:ArnT family glycosyltransferase [Flavobacterium sp. RHBU_3]|uniref:ArnT family glycosyltransferase n=1 Tax=Flavobacterium sp. RHBU_3 TaxID=3391184 RepID=UPI003984C68E